MSGRSSSLLFPPLRWENQALQAYKFVISHSQRRAVWVPRPALPACLNGKWAEEAVDGIQLASKWHFFNEPLSDTHSVIQIQAFRIPHSPASCIQQKLWGSIIYCLPICGPKEPCFSPRRALCLHSPYPTVFYLVLHSNIADLTSFLFLCLWHIGLLTSCSSTLCNAPGLNLSKWVRPPSLKHGNISSSGAASIALLSTTLSPKPRCAHLSSWKGVQKSK